MKDERGLIIRKDKKIYNADGTYRYVPYGVWKAKVINEPLGETARKAMEEKDKDLEELGMDNIPLEATSEVKQTERSPSIPIPTKHKRTTDNTNLLLIEQAKRKGFKSTEEHPRG